MEVHELWYFSFVYRRQQKSYVFYTVFSDMIFYVSPHTTKFRVSKTIPAPVCVVVLMIWHSCYRTEIFEVCGLKSENKFFFASTWQLCWKIWKWILQDSKTTTFQQNTSEGSGFRLCKFGYVKLRILGYSIEVGVYLFSCLDSLVSLRTWVQGFNLVYTPLTE